MSGMCVKLKRTIFLSFIFIFIFIFVHCGEEDSRQEVIDKLRTLGVSSSNLTPSPSAEEGNSESVEVTLHAAIPLGQTASLEAFKDLVDASGVYPIALDGVNIEKGSEVYEEFSTLRIFTARAMITMPKISQLASSPLSFLGTQIRYGLKVRTSDGQEEKVIASLNVLPMTQKKPEWKDPILEIISPTKGEELSIDTDIPIEVRVDNPEEEVKIGWFVTEGAVSNRRARQTTWKFKQPGDKLLIVTAHGKKSRSFTKIVIPVVGK